ncbi:MAG: DUF3836 domain-containing protein [Tannerella sp.]|jgi:hypothetical protein|nr:DUF3836 domain-containing protein [Tannerella sp.]
MKKVFSTVILLMWLPLISLPLAGQTAAGSKPGAADAYEKRRSAGEAILKRDERPAPDPIRLRADASALPDSSVTYTLDGQRLSKAAYTYDAAGNETLYTRYNWENGAWVNSSKYEYAYDAAGRMTLDMYYRWENDAWVNSFKYEYAYDTAGRRTLNASYHWENDTWVNLSKSEYAYDAAGRITLDASYRGENDTWVNLSKYESAYDAAGNTTLSSRYSGENGGWTGDYKYTDAYDAGGQQTSSVYYNWNNGQWVKSSEGSYDRKEANSKTWIYTSVNYNEDGSIRGRGFYIQSNGFYWDQLISEEEQMEYTPVYDADNHLTQVETSILQSGKKVPSRKCVLAYDNGNPVSMQVYRYNGNEVGEMIYQGENTYDADGRLTKFESSEWNGSEWIGQRKMSRKYDAGGKEVFYEYYYWNYSTNDWVGSSKYESTYDAGGKELSYAYYNWDSSAKDWAGNYKRERTYDAGGKELSYTTYRWNSSAKNWVRDYKNESTYDAGGSQSSYAYFYFNIEDGSSRGYKTVYEESNKNGDAVRYKSQTWDDENSRWIDESYTIVYYADGGPNAIEQTVDAETQAYVSGGTLHIRTAHAAQIEIYTLSGVRVYAGRIQAGFTAVSAGSLPKGVLIIRSSSGWVGKVVI